jgi:hypothetical protein
MGDNLTDVFTQVAQKGSTASQSAPPQQPTAPGSTGDNITDVFNQVAGKTPINMIGPDGSQVSVPIKNIDEMRSKNFAIAPQPGVQRMATPQGQLTYALPDEVDKFKASGHVPIDDTGNFRVDPLPGEDNTDTMDRAAQIAKNLPPDVMKQAIAAEAKTITAKRLAANLIAGPVVSGIGVPAAMAGTGELAVPIARVFAPRMIPIAAGTGFGGAAAGETLGPSLASQATTWVGRQLLQHGVKAAVGGGTAGLIYKILSWSK